MANAALEDAVESLAYDTQSEAIKTQWDDTRITLQQQARTVRIPAEIEAHSARAVCKTQIGLFSSIHHLWVSVDDVLYLWDYAQPGARPIAIPSSGTIRAAGLVIPRPGAFDPSVTFLVVIAIHETVHLVGLEHVEVTPLGNVAPRSQLRVNLLDGYSAPTDGVPFDRVRASAGGRIFLSSSSCPHLFEVAYDRYDRYFHSKCRLDNLTAGILSAVKTATRLFAPQNIKLFAVISNFLFVCHEDNTLHLYLIQSPDGRPTFTCLCSVTAREIELLVEKYFQLSRMSPNITHLFPCISTSKALHVMCLTQSGDRLHFTMSCARRQGPGVRGHGQPEIFTSGPHFHFWLSHYSTLGVGQSAASAWRSSQGPPSTKVARNDPCYRPPALYGNGVWIAGEGPLQLAVRADVEADERAVELVGILHVDGEVLAIGEEDEAKIRTDGHMRSSYPETIEGDIGLFSPRRSFVLVTSTGVQFVHLIYQDRQTPTRPPQTVRECARCLGMLRNDTSDSKPPVWMWSMEQGEQPSTWIHGLIFFLAVLLRPFWKVPLVLKMPTTCILSWKADEVRDILARMQCVVAFIRQCQRVAAPTTFEVPSAAHRQLQYTSSVDKRQAALLRANKLLSGVLCIMDRLIEVLVLLKLIHAHKNLSTILTSRFWDVEGKRAFDRLFELRLCDIVNTSAFAPISTLCTAFTNDVWQREGPVSPALVEMAKLAPILYAAAESARPPSNRPQSNASQNVHMVDVHSNAAEVYSASASRANSRQALDSCLQKVR